MTGRTTVPSSFIAPQSPSSPVWPLGNGLSVGGYSVTGGLAMYHMAAVSDTDLREKTPPDEILASAASDGAPRCTLVFETPAALDIFIQQLQDLRKIYDG